jgi:ribosomal protein S18 acetylase RimI-like enzyme
VNYNVIINIPITKDEVPMLRERIGWERRDGDYPSLFERCNFWAGARNETNKLIAFGYITGMGLQHGYMEDILVHPDYKNLGIGIELVKELLRESERFELDIVTLTYDEKHSNFYQASGFTPCLGGVWRRNIR